MFQTATACLWCNTVYRRGVTQFSSAYSDGIEYGVESPSTNPMKHSDAQGLY